jgi:hypothetical protein
MEVDIVRKLVWASLSAMQWIAWKLLCHGRGRRHCVSKMLEEALHERELGASLGVHQHLVGCVRRNLACRSQLVFDNIHSSDEGLCREGQQESGVKLGVNYLPSYCACECQDPTRINTVRILSLHEFQEFAVDQPL